MPTDTETMLVQMAEMLRTRHFGKYRGIVADIADPDDQCRIRAQVPAIYTDRDSPWALPALPFAGDQHGLVLLPQVGDGVWIEFEGGDISRPIWSGCWFASGQRPSPNGEKARLLATSAGHQILVDEDADEITLVHPGGAEVTLGASEITLTLGSCSLKITTTEINLNNGMVKVTTAGASLVNDAFKVGA
jgi:Type VI secretion system/phage-baseplate injector OB domain